MRLAVVGAGAMGGSLAGHAARAGHEVTVIEVVGDLVDHINREGITVDAPEGSFIAKVSATSDPAIIGPVDVVVVFVKAQHTRSAALAMGPMVGNDTAVVTLQNGWGNANLLADEIPAERLVMGVTYNSCTLLGPGHIVHSGRGRTVVGPYTGTDLTRSDMVAQLLNSSGWEAEASSGVKTEIWKKLVLNCATLPTAALTRLSAGALGQPGELLHLVDGLAAEAVAVGLAQGLVLDATERTEAIHQVLARAGSGKPSMLQDVLVARKTEIETVNGAVVAAGDADGIDVPLNRAMVALVHGLERSWKS